MAFKWFEKAYKKRITKATINNDGLCFFRGFGNQQNIEKAIEILNKLSLAFALFLNQIANYFKGVMLYKGQGCIQNTDEGYKILNDLSKNGNDQATEFFDLIT